MIKTLVSVDPDLSSSIALRYTCQLAQWFEMQIQAIHAGKTQSGVLAGWASRTWEKTQLEESKKEIEQLLTAEKRSCPVSISPIIVSGDPKKEILEHLEKGRYDLFVEGVPRPLSTKVLSKRFQVPLYKAAPCPVLLVQNLLPVEKVLLVLRERPLSRALLAGFNTLFKGAGWIVEGIIPKFLPPCLEKEEAEKLLEDYECPVKMIHDVESIGELSGFSDYGMVAVGVNRTKLKDSSILEIMEKIPSPMLFCWA